MLQAFIDDSGNDGKSPVFILAGYIASAENWERFSNEWEKTLKPEDGMNLGVLKMADVYRNRVRGSRYYGWADDQRDQRLKSLIKVINSHALHGIVSIVPYKTYDAFIKGKFNPPSLDRACFLSFFGIMTRLLAVAQQLKLDDRIDFIFDSQDSENKPLLMAEYDRFISLAPPEIRALSGGYPEFKRDEDSLPLQAADMLAWHVRRYYFDLYNGKDPTKEPSNIYLANLFKPAHDVLDIWDKARIKQVADVLSKSSWRKPQTFGKGVVMTLPDPSLTYRF
jgi:hypothetical protein